MKMDRGNMGRSNRIRHSLLTQRARICSQKKYAMSQPKSRLKLAQPRRWRL